jgi:hypothetical protein
MAASDGEVNFTTEPVELPGVTPADPPTVQVPGRVWHGGCPVDFEWVRRTGIDLIVDLADADSVAPAADVDGLTYLKCPLVDGSELPSPTLTLGLAELVADLVRDGRRALIHCTFGRNRSGLLATLVVRDLLGLSGADALAHVQAHREGTVNNEDFARWLRSLPAPAAAAASA